MLKASPAATSCATITLHHGIVRGYAVMADRNSRVRAKGYRSVILERTIVLARNNGYRHHFASNRPDLPG